MLSFVNNIANKGFLLIFTTIIALFMANTSGLSDIYMHIINANFVVHYSNKIFNLPVDFIVNDVMMSIFFLIIGIDIKKELVSGHLASRTQRILPLICACCGVIIPLLIYCLINKMKNISGCFIPSATDITFTIAVISAFSNKIPAAIKVFVIALAIIDDLIAVIAIAIFHTNALNLDQMLNVILCIITLHALQKKKVSNFYLYIFVGIVLWLCIYFVGIHTTVAGVILGLYLPKNIQLEKYLQHAVQYLIMPIFAFFNAGIVINNLSADLILSPVTIGVMLGLLLGKQLGIFSSFYLLVKTKLVAMPQNSNFIDAYIASVLCGIGFTMSLFIASLAFDVTSIYITQAKIGILLGSILSCILGITLLSFRDTKN